MLQYLTYLMQDAIELSMNTSRKAHVVVFQDMEKGKINWEQLDLVETFKNRNTHRLDQGCKTDAGTQDRIQPCIHLKGLDLIVTMFSIIPFISTFVHMVYEKLAGSLNMLCRSV